MPPAAQREFIDQVLEALESRGLKQLHTKLLDRLQHMGPGGRGTFNTRLRDFAMGYEVASTHASETSPGEYASSPMPAQRAVMLLLASLLKHTLFSASSLANEELAIRANSRATSSEQGFNSYLEAILRDKKW